jgi:hypothetical protein
VPSTGASAWDVAAGRVPRVERPRAFSAGPVLPRRCGARGFGALAHGRHGTARATPGCGSGASLPASRVCSCWDLSPFARAPPRVKSPAKQFPCGPRHHPAAIPPLNVKKHRHHRNQRRRCHACDRGAPHVHRVNAIGPAPFPPRCPRPSCCGRCTGRAHGAPLGRIGRPADLTGVVVFLTSAASSSGTGQPRSADGD